MTVQQVRVTVDEDAARPSVIWLDTGEIRLGLVPELGGRLLSAQVGGVETLWRNRTLLDDRLHPVAGHQPEPVAGRLADWINYGGDKTWPAPQGWSGPHEWAGPPDPVLDSGPYEWNVDRHGRTVTVGMTSAPDPRTGLQLSRRYSLVAGASGWDLEIAARNISGRPVTWALWNVVQRTAGALGSGGVFVGIEPGRDPGAVGVVVGTGVPSYRRVGDDRVLVPHQNVVGKVGFRAASGWLAHVAGATTTSISFDVEDSEYPDGGCRVEVWLENPLDEPLKHLGDLRPTDSIVEIEVLGPLRRLGAGDVMTLSMRCVVTATRDGDVTGVDGAGRAVERALADDTRTNGTGEVVLWSAERPS